MRYVKAGSRLGAFLIFLIVSVDAVAQSELLSVIAGSQPPIPSVRIKSDEPQNEATANYQNTNNTEANITPIIASTPSVNSVNADKGPHQNPPDADDKTSADWWLVKLTGGLVLVGLLQFIIFCFQYCAFRKQADFMRRTIIEMKKGTFATINAANAARDSANAAKVSADAANAQTGHLEASVAATKKAANAAEISANAAITNERPVIFVDSIICDKFTPENTKEWIERLFPVLNVSNYGRTPAFVEDIILNAEIAKFLPPQPVYSHYNAAIAPCFVIGSHKSKKHMDITLYNEKVSFDQSHIDEMMNRKQYLFLYGYVSYKDLWNNRYHHGFVFAYLVASDKFIQADTYPKYNYHNKIV